MQLFAILGLSADQGVLERIQEQFPDDHLQINPSTFFVACEGEVTKGLAEKLGIGTEKESGGLGIVVPIHSHWGYHNASIWEWLSVKRQAG